MNLWVKLLSKRTNISIKSTVIKSETNKILSKLTGRWGSQLDFLTEFFSTVELPMAELPTSVLWQVLLYYEIKQWLTYIWLASTSYYAYNIFLLSCFAVCSLPSMSELRGSVLTQTRGFGKPTETSMLKERQGLRWVWSWWWGGDSAPRISFSVSSKYTWQLTNIVSIKCINKVYVKGQYDQEKLLC